MENIINTIRISKGLTERDMARYLNIKTSVYRELEKTLRFSVSQYFTIIFVLGIGIDQEI